MNESNITGSDVNPYVDPADPDYVIRAPHNAQNCIVTFKSDILWTRHIDHNRINPEDEVWYLTPPNRYVVAANQLNAIKQQIDTISDMAGASLYKPLSSSSNIHNSKILVERYRDRGFGDLLFMTGPLEYLRHMSGNTCKIFFYTLADRAAALKGNPALQNKNPRFGALCYDTFSQYDAHWLVPTVTEYCEERDQLNVYDALYRSMGIDHARVDAKFKRPYYYLDDQDRENMHNFAYFAHLQYQRDLRSSGYYVVAPTTHSALRAAPYAFWLQLIQTLSERRPVVVIGNSYNQQTEYDMSAGEFKTKVNEMADATKGKVINMLNDTDFRSAAGIIAMAKAVVCVDSAPLYVAQALNVPAISLWGTHDPRTRIGYSKEYMDLAIHNSHLCTYSPCYSYANFPARKCPQGPNQTQCQPLRGTSHEQVLEKINMLEQATQTLPTFSPATPSETVPADSTN